ncbi:MAG: sulfatase-like hydrolase/transferase [Acidobacteriota bacterium]
MKFNGRKPNILIFMVDEERYPVCYETDAVKEYCNKYLIAQNLIRKTGIEFHRHYVASTACTPSRTSFFTGQYPSLHGVTQTDGLAKSAYDADMYWLDPNTVPTLGDYFRTAGYRTFYKGKWHISHADILVPGTHQSLQIYDSNGNVIVENVQKYAVANRLDDFGFSGWIGPEPHGPAKINCGTNCDPLYAQEAIELLDRLEHEETESTSQPKPWLLVNSYVNPHDIVLFALQYLSFGYPMSDDTVPDIPEPRTENENLDTKPRCQTSYVKQYPKMLLPQPTIEIYRKFYYYLQKLADQQVLKVFDRLRNSIFFENTFVVFTSDHGEMLGAHGGMHQKWYNAYEESIHVPFIISNPVLFKESKKVNALTSHVDVIPTLLGLADIDVAEVQEILSQDHTEVHRLVGRDLSGVVLGSQSPDNLKEPIYFMTDDEVSEGLNQTNPLLGFNYHSVVQPGHIETVIATLNIERMEQVWKYSRYFDNKEFWSNPPDSDNINIDGREITKTQPIPDEFEMYNLSEDPLEECNLAHPSNQTPESEQIRKQLQKLLMEQCQQKRLTPRTRTTPSEV